MPKRTFARVPTRGNGVFIAVGWIVIASSVFMLAAGAASANQSASFTFSLKAPDGLQDIREPLALELSFTALKNLNQVEATLELPASVLYVEGAIRIGPVDRMDSGETAVLRPSFRFAEPDFFRLPFSARGLDKYGHWVFSQVTLYVFINAGGNITASFEPIDNPNEYLVASPQARDPIPPPAGTIIPSLGEIPSDYVLAYRYEGPAPNSTPKVTSQALPQASVVTVIASVVYNGTNEEAIPARFARAILYDIDELSGGVNLALTQNPSRPHSDLMIRMRAL